MKFDKSRNFAFTLTKERFSMAEKKKFGKKLFFVDVESSWIAGFLNAYDDVFKSHKENPYATVEELLGDMHTWSKDYFNYYNIKHARGKLRRIEVEDFLEEGE